MHTIILEFNDVTQEIIGQFNGVVDHIKARCYIEFVDNEGKSRLHMLSGNPTKVDISSSLEREAIRELGHYDNYVMLRDGSIVTRDSIEWKNECLQLTEEANGGKRDSIFGKIVLPESQSSKRSYLPNLHVIADDQGKDEWVPIY